ncbi:MAG: hypothetical protein KAU26_11320 [Methylococcales bacterium]|nr:hypothetical protein [Methylococcales bacterium]
MNTDNRELIVRKNHALHNPDRGTLDILFVSLDNGKNIKLPDREFPTKGVFISKDFEHIDKQFKESELFCLQNWNESDDGYSPESHHSHWAFGTYAKALDPLAFIPIYKGKLPDISTGYTDIPNLPANKAFFIRDGSDIYGPFSANARLDNEGAKASPYPQPVLSIKQKYILKISYKILEENEIITPALDNTDLQYIVSLRKLPSIPEIDREEVDFISDEQLIAYFSKLKFGKKTILSKKEAEKLKIGVESSIKKRELKDDDKRVERLQDILDKYLNKSDIGDKIVDNYFNSKLGKDYLNVYIESKPDLATKASDDVKEGIEIQEEKLKKLQNEIQAQILAQRERVENEKIKASFEVEKAKKEADKEIEKIQQKSKEERKREEQEAIGTLKADIIDLENEKEKLRKNVDELYEEEKEIKNLKKVQRTANYLEVHVEKLKEAVKTQQTLLSNPNLGGKITEVKTVLDMLQGRSLDQKDEQYEFKLPKITETIPDQADQYIQTLVEYIEKDDYSITFEEVTNLLINIQQSFLTVLAGLPGSGKTSSVMRLAISQGLCSQSESNSDCFLNVPIARGWVSSRDFVGFNNSLKGVFQPAKTGVYQFLRQSEQVNSDEVLRMILLDEANLSPLEHYWSEFLAMCDKEGRNRPLDTGVQGKKRYLKVANNIRFIATINNDNTTEPLSPRLCDRVPIITMDAPHIESAKQRIASLSLDGAIPYECLDKWFGIPSDSDLTPDSLILECCELMKTKDSSLGAEIYISQRKINAMTAYCEVAKEYISHPVEIDFALSQHALPLINGHGKEFKKRLEKLEEWAKSNNLERTSALLQNILKAGETYIDSYSFF